MPDPHPEWRILAELAQQPLATPELRERLRHGPPMSKYVFSTRLGRLRAWGWITAARSEGRRPSVMVYSITKQGRQALELVRQRGEAARPVSIEQVCGGGRRMRRQAAAAARPVEVEYAGRRQAAAPAAKNGAAKPAAKRPAAARSRAKTAAAKG